MEWHWTIFQWLISHHRECFLIGINISVLLLSLSVASDSHRPPQNPFKPPHHSLSTSLSASPGRGPTRRSVGPLFTLSTAAVAFYHPFMLRASRRITFCSFLQQNLREVMRPENQTVAVMTVVLFTNQYKGGGTARASFTTEPVTHRTISFPALFLLLIPQTECLQFTARTRECKMPRELCIILSIIT